MRNYGDFRHTCNPHDNYMLIIGYTLWHGDSPYFYGGKICSAANLAKMWLWIWKELPQIWYFSIVFSPLQCKIGSCMYLVQWLWVHLEVKYDNSYHLPPPPPTIFQKTSIFKSKLAKLPQRKMNGNKVFFKVPKMSFLVPQLF